MINLTTTSDIIRLITSAAVALDVQASYVDHTASAYTPGRQLTTITTATTTTVVSAPAASTQRSLKHLRAHARGGANTVTVEYFDGTNAFRALSVSLLAGETLEYTDTVGWRVQDASGAEKTTGVGSGRLLRAPQVLTSGTSISHPTGTATIFVRVLGAGGGSTGCANSAGGQITVGGGGASGAYAERTFVASSLTSTYTIGAGGTAGANTGAAAGTGGSTTFTHGGVTVTCPGGTGAPLNTTAGMAGASGATVGSTPGGAPGAVSTNGDVNFGGSPGGIGLRFSGTAAQSGAGAGGPFGGAGIGRTTQGAGNAASGPGAGAGGGLSINAGGAVSGAAGGGGLIIVEELT